MTTSADHSKRILHADVEAFNNREAVINILYDVTSKDSDYGADLMMWLEEQLEDENERHEYLKNPGGVAARSHNQRVTFLKGMVRTIILTRNTK